MARLQLTHIVEFRFETNHTIAGSLKTQMITLGREMPTNHKIAAKKQPKQFCLRLKKCSLKTYREFLSLNSLNFKVERCWQELEENFKWTFQTPDDSLELREEAAFEIRKIWSRRFTFVGLPKLWKPPDYNLEDSQPLLPNSTGAFTRLQLFLIQKFSLKLFDSAPSIRIGKLN